MDTQISQNEDLKRRLKEATELMKNHKISGILVVNKNLKLVGILTNRDVRFVTDKKIKVKDLMTKELVTAKVGTSITEAKKILFKNKIEKLIIVDNNFKCRGLITVKDIQKSQIYPEAAKDKNYEKYLKIRKRNLHKMNLIPICKFDNNE